MFIICFLVETVDGSGVVATKASRTQYQQGHPQCSRVALGLRCPVRGPGLLPGDDTPAAVGSESMDQGNARGRPLCLGREALPWCPGQTGVEQVHLPGKSRLSPGRGGALGGLRLSAFGAWLPPEGADARQSPSGALWAVQPALLPTPRGRPACRWRLRLLPRSGCKRALPAPTGDARPVTVLALHLGQRPSGRPRQARASMGGGPLPPW